MLRNFWKSLAAVVVGNAVYFLLMAHLPPAARHAPNRLDLGLAVDFLFCVAVYGVVDLAQRRRGRSADEPGRK
jgi:hypothetical protein